MRFTERIGRPPRALELGQTMGQATVCRSLGASFSRRAPSSVTTTMSSIRIPNWPSR